MVHCRGRKTATREKLNPAKPAEDRKVNEDEKNWTAFATTNVNISHRISGTSCGPLKYTSQTEVRTLNLTVL